MTDLLNLKEASEWASNYLGRQVTNANISYLLRSGRVKKHGSNRKPLIDVDELKKYYDSYVREKMEWERTFGGDVDWHLSFAECKESERTKHVHRLHPYKGKFIPQLVEYFIDEHTDEFKEEIFFRKGDIILDPFCGSGTTLVQANELGIHAIGVDVSAFNAQISNVKVERHDIAKLEASIQRLTLELERFQRGKNNVAFEKHLSDELAAFNKQHFPSPDYKRKVRQGSINEMEYSREKESEFSPIYWGLVEEYGIQIMQKESETFLDKWFLHPVREEIDFLAKQIEGIKDIRTRRVLEIILSRTVRSCRATTHADLATLKEPVTSTYYCKKHGKICKPIFSIMGWWRRYSVDTLNRLRQFEKIRTNTMQICLVGDSREIDIIEELAKKNPTLSKIVSEKGVAGIFSSPPYVGLINYHEQHAYAYDILGFERRDELEIGPLFQGKGKIARETYIKGIAKALRNCRKFLREDYNVFLVANDKFNLYPRIAELAGMKIVNQYKRPVINRAEKNRSVYAETIFHLREK